MSKTKIVGFQSGHDVSYCILENGIPVLCEELERISRVKMQMGDGLKLFFDRGNQTQDIDYFAFGNWGNRKGRAARRCMDIPSDLKMKDIMAQNGAQYFEFGHHMSHGANAFYTSNFEEALIITMDGGGNEDDRVRTAFAMSRGIDNRIERILTIPVRKLNLGSMWHFATRDVFGLSNGYPKGGQEGTVMAMATLGKPLYADFFYDYYRNVEKLKTIANSSEQEKFNAAASLQEYTEIVFRTTVSEYMKGYKNLCLSGGVSLNCVLTAKIKKWFPQIKNVFCDPVPYDAGLALGSARYLWHHVLGNPRIKNNIQNMSPYLGKAYFEADIKNACGKFADKIKLTLTSDDEVLYKINTQKIISVFGGRSEIGRRALGNRSILADLRNPEMKAIINEKVKHREWFRPFAPSILEEKVDEWFEDPILSPYMSFALKFRNEVKDKVPAVVHYDGTGRVQTVNKYLNPWFHSFLSKWEAISGVPILLNTSFNDSEPIVETPEDALKCFLGTKINYLYFFDYGILVEKTK